MGRVKLPFVGRRRSEPVRRGSHVARGSMISHAGESLAARLRELGVPVHDPLRDAYAAGRFGTARSGGGMLLRHVAAGDKIPRGSKITRAPSNVVPRGEDDGTVWNGPEVQR